MTQEEKPVAGIWREMFARWPSGFRRKGVLVPSFGEAIAFQDFVINSDVIVLERPTPDTVGARRVAIPFGLIEAIKYTEPLKTEQFLESGFITGVASQNPASGTTSNSSEPAVAAS